jgi:hypothetical protein
LAFPSDWTEVFRDRRKMPILILVKVRFQNPRKTLEVLEHPVLLLRSQQQWLDRNRWKRRNDCHQFLRDALGVRSATAIRVVYFSEHENYPQKRT